MLHGYVPPSSSRDEKVHAQRRVTGSFLPRSWANAIPVNETTMQGAAIPVRPGYILWVAPKKRNTHNSVV